ncbi:FAD-binding dehydrogenase [Gordonibacter sp. An230]|uniref:FAD-dependent oxidoreductase n=1 Tax=Gordonibacter sp. An230 TaxID=1965592 RepID=UPI000B3928D4|nr:FAD-dependent oxidoreductase [Gordonibacter sp. An230]OUO92010.1 FAD-binding dehydrogenase [Gordonibacter sp. An230]
MSTRSGLSRRTFLGLGATAAVAAGAGLAGCAPQSSTSANASGKSASNGTSESSWKTPPEEITEFAQEIDCDVVVCGHGFAGITACRELAEEGYRVVLVEKQPEETYAAVGNEAGTLNASILKERGVPEIDPVEFYQNWMLITGNYPNQELVMKYAQNSGANMDWYLSELTEEDFATMTTAFFPKTEHQLDELGGVKFWPSVCSFYGECNQTKIHGYNREVAKANGAEFLFGTEALYIVMSDGQVAGLVATNADGNIKFTCRAVVIACGGFGGNPEMLADLIPDMAGALVGEEQLTSMSANDGRGVQMAYWAGAHLETCPIPGMNMKGLSVPGKMNCLPQAVWIDENGKRFCNEFYPTSEQRGLSTVYTARKTKFAVCDANFPEYRQYTIPQHAGFNATEENIAALRESLDVAYAKYQGTYEEPEQAEDEGGPGGSGPQTTVEFIADDTLEGLAAQMGLEGEAVANFVKTIEDYNAYCEAGADQQFGRDARVLFPVKEPPFFACTFDPVLGETMVTCGGIITDGEQNALDENFEPIPGLYVSGNDCGRRFGYDYITPIPGVSLGMAITLGRECGKSVGAFLG